MLKLDMLKLDRLKVAAVLALLAASFFGGVYYPRQDTAELGKLNRTVQALTAQLEQEKARSQELDDTLRLVKRQLQADRIAYETLQESVAAAESARAALREKVAAQQELLKKLRD